MADLLLHYPMSAPENLRRQQAEVSGFPISVYSAFDFVGYPIKQDTEFNFDPLNPPVNGANVINGDMRVGKVTIYPKSTDVAGGIIDSDPVLQAHLQDRFVFYGDTEGIGAGQGLTFGSESSFGSGMEPTGYTDVDIFVDFFTPITLAQPTVSAGGRGGDHFVLGQASVEQITIGTITFNYLYRNSSDSPFYLENSDLLSASLNSISTYAVKFTRFKFVFLLILLEETGTLQEDMNDEAETKYQSAIDTLAALGVDAELVAIPGPASGAAADILAAVKTRLMAFFS